MAFRAEARDYDDLRAALHARADQLGASRHTLDDLIGFAQGYSGKLLGSKAVRGALTKISLGPMLTALGLKLVVVEDKEALARMLPRITPRDETAVRHRHRDAG